MGGLEDVVVLIAKAKLSNLSRVMRYGGASLWATIQGGAWIKEAKQLIEDVLHEDNEEKRPKLDEKPEWWIGAMEHKERKGEWKRIKEAAARIAARKDEEKDKDGGEEESEKEDDEVWCHVCYKVFASLQAAASHRNRAHSVGNAGWAFASDGK